MNPQALATFRPTTLAAMAADLSQYLADNADVISAQEWNAMHAQLRIIVDEIGNLVGIEQEMKLLMDAGADPEVIYVRT